MDHHLARRFTDPRPKRILALDGGGVRGILSIAFLEEIERTLADRFVAAGRYGDPTEFRLSHYFDLIGGTSVGSMIGTMLAMDWPVSMVKKRFTHAAGIIFGKEAETKAPFDLRVPDKLKGLLTPKFHAGPITREVKKIVHDDTLASELLSTGLVVVLKRANTGSVWPVINNPHGKYWNDAQRDDGSIRLGNRNYRLWELIRASTAAPTYFSAQQIDVMEGEADGLFIDGGVSPHNNPALQLLMMAGISGYRLGGVGADGAPRAWKLGGNNLQIISVGTGSYAHTYNKTRFEAYDAMNGLRSVMADCQDLVLTLMHWLSATAAPWPIDREIGDLASDVMGQSAGRNEPLIDFRRYDIRLEEGWLAKNLPTFPPRTTDEMKALRDFTDENQIGRLYDYGRAIAREQVKAGHFSAGFDGIWGPQSGA